MHAALGRTQHGVVQLAAYTVVKPDKGFEEDAVLGFIDGGKHRRIIAIAIFQQRDPVPTSP
ncbi:hypothetical protein D3C75_1285180 [compost metagenome]